VVFVRSWRVLTVVFVRSWRVLTVVFNTWDYCFLFTLFIIWYFNEHCFRNWMCSHTLVRGWETRALLGLLERSYHNHWT
jgi:hypothetical protein